MSHRIFRLLMVAILMIGLVAVKAPSSARAVGPWYVSNAGDDNNDCLSPSSACATINAAIGKASSGDTIRVAVGTYTSTATNGVGVVWMNQNITLTLLGGWDQSFTAQIGMSTIDGQSARGGINSISDGNLTVDHFVIQNGNNGGIVIESFGSSLSTLVLSHSVVSNNFNDYGGGIEINYGTVILNNSIVNNNTASISGGGIYIYGGGVTLNNSTISENIAQAQGGGIYYNYLNTSLDVNSSSIVNNHSSQGGGLYRYLNSGLIMFRNSILANNTAPMDSDCTGTINTSGYNLIGNTSGCTFTPNTGDLTNVNPVLGPLQDNGGSTSTHALLPGSPAIDAGNPAGCTDQNGNPLTTDQRGAARPQGGRCDIGAFELEAVNPVIQVSIDIIPGSATNLINIRSAGTIPVAILSTATFNAPAIVNKTSLTFGKTGNEASLSHCLTKQSRDVNGDGRSDLICYFRVGMTGLAPGATQAILRGQTMNGTAFEGMDFVKVAGSKNH